MTPRVLTERLHVQVHHEDGTLWAEVVVDMPGCFATGATLEELREALAEAIGLCVSTDHVAVTIRVVEMKPLQREDDVDIFAARVPEAV